MGTSLERDGVNFVLLRISDHVPIHPDLGIADLHNIHITQQYSCRCLCGRSTWSKASGVKLGRAPGVSLRSGRLQSLNGLNIKVKRIIGTGHSGQQ